MEHKNKREPKPRGDQQIILRWKDPQTNQTHDSEAIYYGDTLDKKYKPSEFRERLIQAGLQKGLEFLGQVIGTSQIRMPLKHSGLYKIAATERVLTLWNPKFDRVELWKRDDELPGYLIEYMGHGYKLNATIQNEENGQLTKKELLKLRTLRRMHSPMPSQIKPTEEVEREVFTEASEEGYETFKRTGRAPIPVPSRKELDAITQTVEVAARDDSGNVVPTPEYFALNQLSPNEIVPSKAPRHSHFALASTIARIASDEHNNKTKDLSLMLEAVYNSIHNPDHEIERIIKQGQKFDFEIVSQDLDACLAEEEATSAAMKALAHDVLGMLAVQQVNEYREGIYTPPLAHLVSSVTMPIIMGQDQPLGLCGEKADKYVGLDQYKYAGAPAFTPICPNCLAKLGIQDEIHAQGGLTQPRSDFLSDPKTGDGILHDMTQEAMRQYSADPQKDALKGEFEDWVKRKVISEYPYRINFWYYHQMALCLFSYGTQRVEGADRPVVHYILCDWTAHKIVSQGSDFSPSVSLWIEPTGARAAAQFLAFKEEDDPDFIYEWRQDLFWRDQYGDPIPRDLVLINNTMGFALTRDEDEIEVHERVMASTWYEVKEYLFVSATDVPQLDSDDTLEDMGINIEEDRIMRVDNPLKRFGTDSDKMQGGIYYHA